MRILVLEDDPDVRELYRDDLTDAGHDVETASNGLEGLAKLAKDPQLVLVDLMMPLMDGYEFLQRMRRTPGHETTPALVLSAVATGAWARMVGANAFVPKPFDVDELRLAVQRFA